MILNFKASVPGYSFSGEVHQPSWKVTRNGAMCSRDSSVHNCRSGTLRLWLECMMGLPPRHPPWCGEGGDASQSLHTKLYRLRIFTWTGTSITYFLAHHYPWFRDNGDVTSWLGAEYRYILSVDAVYPQELGSASYGLEAGLGQLGYWLIWNRLTSLYLYLFHHSNATQQQYGCDAAPQLRLYKITQQ